MNLYSNTNILIRILTILRVSKLPTRLNVCAYGFWIYTYMDMYILTRIHRKNKISHYSIGVSTMGALGSTFSRRVTKTQKPRSKKGHFHTLVVLLNATVIFFFGFCIRPVFVFVLSRQWRKIGGCASFYWFLSGFCMSVIVWDFFVCISSWFRYYYFQFFYVR